METQSKPSKDWVLSKIEGQPGFCRFRVTGINLCEPAESADRSFSWAVNTLWNRYDATNAEIDSEAIRLMEESGFSIEID